MTPENWSLGLTGVAQAEYKDIVRRARAVGELRPIHLALVGIREVLLRSPREFGEPLRHLRAMRMTVRNAAILPLYVEFGVHDEEPLVVIRRFRWMSAPDE